MKSWVDFSGGSETNKSIVDILLGANVAMFGVFEHWSEVNIVVVGAASALVSLILFKHIAPLKTASLRSLIWTNGALVGIGVIIYGLIVGWWDVITLWLCKYLQKPADKEITVFEEIA